MVRYRPESLAFRTYQSIGEAVGKKYSKILVLPFSKTQKLINKSDSSLDGYDCELPACADPVHPP
jgi:hypothetical protein